MSTLQKRGNIKREVGQLSDLTMPHWRLIPLWVPARQARYSRLEVYQRDSGKRSGAYITIYNLGSSSTVEIITAQAKTD